jgi:hypothetical protein
MSDELDQILSEKDEIVPSSGFVEGVMNAVQSEAAAPPPIPFPWKRALPGLAVAGLASISLLVAGVETLSSRTTATPGTPALAPAWASIFGTSRVLDAGWIALALVLSFISVKLSMHFTQRES